MFSDIISNIITYVVYHFHSPQIGEWAGYIVWLVVMIVVILRGTLNLKSSTRVVHVSSDLQGSAW